MNPNHPTDSASGVPWPTSDHRVRVPDTSLLPGGESAAAVAREGAASAAAAEEVLQVTAEQMSITRDAWAQRMRATVRRNPLLSLAAALALGMVVARLTH
jgi:hypothetical protein